ncbi:AGC family protein kinase [Histomonas meleagridis]|uniref:AGC family protein kinase n=1 Tax=Histomonas meleagridis TaxID=135588 RepID=UPI00355AC145|nr:AGC family protein kinase [Histomonas meleagridis]
MTSVVRPAAITYNFDPNILNEIANDIGVSRETQIKVISIRQFFDDHYNKISNDAIERERRHTKINNFLSKENLTQEEREEYYQKFLTEESTYTRVMRTRFKAERYVRLKMIGRGGYGEVWLAGDRTTSELCALKVLKKAKIIIDQQVNNVRSERDVLSISNNPWIVELKCSFQDQEYLYLSLEYVPGDLKPDNILINLNGHIKLTDFGLATNYSKPEIDISLILDEIGFTIDQINEIYSSRNSGRPHHTRDNHIEALSIDYASPELLCGQNATPSSDFWAVGVILYEMIYGYPPFYSKKAKHIARKILNWTNTLQFPVTQNATIEAVDLMRHLICDETERYGFEEIISHPFFNGFDFEEPFSNTPPFIPIIKSPTDTSHFEQLEPLPHQTCGHIPLSDLAQFAFVGFTYKPRPNNTVLSSFE